MVLSCSFFTCIQICLILQTLLQNPYVPDKILKTVLEQQKLGDTIDPSSQVTFIYKSLLILSTRHVVFVNFTYVS